MICEPCKSKRHKECPNNRSFDDIKTGLTAENDKVQKAGLCPCQHRVLLMKEISLVEAEDRIRAGIDIQCGCGGGLSAGPGEPVGDMAKFIKLWFEDHSYEDLLKHGLLVREAENNMEKASA